MESMYNPLKQQNNKNFEEYFSAEIAKIKEIKTEEHFHIIHEETLFNRKLSFVIDYLSRLQKKYGDVRLIQQWHSYEDNYFAITWTSPETNRGYKRRVNSEIQSLKMRYQALLAQEKEKQLEIRKQISELQEQLQKM